jgi:predicted esterase
MVGAAMLALLACDDDSTQPALSGPADAAVTVDLAITPDALELDATPIDAELDAEVDAAIPDAEIDAAIPDLGPQPRTPPPLPTYSGAECPPLVSGPTRDTSLNAGFMTGGVGRDFRLLVPSDYDPNKQYPLVFAWHWLAGTSAQLIREGEIESAIDQWQFIVVAFDRRVNEEGGNSYAFVWPFVEAVGGFGAEGTDAAELEYTFFDDTLACVTEQFNVDPTRIYGLGVSAGALWLTHLLNTPRVDHFAAIEIVSGGLANLNDAWRMDFEPRAHRFPTFVLWGGESDRLGINFHDASQRLRDALLDFGHFVTTCTHDAGHDLPPITAPEGQTRFRMLWRFFTDHPYGLDPGDSPYLRDGLPEEFEAWCEIPAP